ncbi:MAG: PilN domain-containing protein [Thermodesulfovibrionales bacterium]|jgi:general secretion pathway protein L
MSQALSIAKLTSFFTGPATRLKGTREMLWGILTFSPADDAIAAKKSICVSIESGDVSLAYGARFLSRLKIKEFTRISEGPGFPQAEDLASAVALAVNNAQAARTDITLSIPKTWAIITTAELPSVVKESISDVVAYELDRLTPLSPGEAYYDYRILRESDGKLTISIVAARIDKIEPYLEALREKGLQVSRITVNLSCIGTLCHFIAERKNTLFIETHEGGYEGAFFFDGCITGAFNGTFTASDEQRRTDVIMKEIQSFQDAVANQGDEPQVVMLLGRTTSPLKELLKLRTTVPLMLLDESDLKLKLPEPLKDVPYSSVGGVLESLWSKSRGLDLLKQGRRETIKAPLGVSLILLFITVIILILLMLTPFRMEEKRIAEIDAQIKLKKDEMKKVEALKKDVDALSTDVSTIVHFKENGPLSLNILKELTTILPKTTWLTRVRITDATVEIEGYASSATELLPKLEASKYFKKSEFASPTFRDARMNADRFIIKMEIEGVKKTEPAVKGKSGKK